MTLQAFCRQHVINPHTFQYWRSKFRKEKKKLLPLQWMQATLEEIADTKMTDLHTLVPGFQQ